MVDLYLNGLNNRLMSPKEQKVAAGLSVFLTAAPTHLGRCYRLSGPTYFSKYYQR